MRADDPKIDDLIESEQFHHSEGTKAVSCVTVMKNNHHIVVHGFKGDKSPYEANRVEENLREQTRRRIAALESYREKANRAEHNE